VQQFEHTAPIFSKLFTACTEIIEAIGQLRNHLSDSHGRGPFGETPDWRQRYTLERLAKSPIGDKIASKLQLSDIIAHCEMRQRQGIAPSTITQDIVYLRVALGRQSDELFGEALVALRAMKLVGKSNQRTRRPTDEERAALLQFFRKQTEHANTMLDMVDVIDFAIASGRPLRRYIRCDGPTSTLRNGLAN
jgi:hypothetical protein